MADDPNKQSEELEALKARVAELEARAKPPEPFKPDRPYQRYDPTANMSMPLSTLLEMANAVPDHVLRGILRDNRAPTGPSSQGAIPSSQTLSNVRGAGGGVPGMGTGWAHEIPLGPSMHQRHVEALLDAQDAKDRRELIEQKAREQALLKAAEPKS